MNDLVSELHHFEMRKVHLPHGANGELDSLLSVLPGPRAQLPADISQRPQNARPIETLPFAMFAVIHAFSIPQPRRFNARTS